MSELRRRHFLAASSAATVSMAPLLAKAHIPATVHTGPSAPRWNIVAVAPSSAKLPSAGADYRGGVELGLARHGLEQSSLQWLYAGASPRKAVKDLQAVLAQHPDAQMVMGWIPPAMAAQASPLLQERGLPMWISDTGADETEVRRHHPLQVRHSLELLTVTAELAKRVHAHLGARAVLSLGWHESGFDFVQAFQQQYRAMGGRVVATHIAGKPGQASEFDGLRYTLVQNRADAIVALHSGPQAIRFAEWWQSHGRALPSQSALAGMPWLADHPATCHALTVGAWPSYAAAAPEWQQRFDLARLPWNPASLLGAEAGYSLGAALATLPSNTSAPTLVKAWRTQPLNGPRGPRQWQAQGHDSQGPLWAAAGGRTNNVSQPFHPRAKSAQSVHLARSGWVGGYLLT